MSAGVPEWNKDRLYVTYMKISKYLIKSTACFEKQGQPLSFPSPLTEQNQTSPWAKLLMVTILDLGVEICHYHGGR